MTPKYPMPSAHAIMTGIFKPNKKDIMLGASNHFGSTIAVLAQDEANPVLTKECFSDSPTA